MGLTVVEQYGSYETMGEQSPPREHSLGSSLPSSDARTVGSRKGTLANYSRHPTG